MEIDIFAVGDEVLYGYTTNSNASFIAQNLLERGFLPTMHTVVADCPNTVREQLVAALKRGRLVIMTGGLGPTVDDLTRTILAVTFNVPLVKHEVLRKRLEKISCTPSSIEDQLIQPEGAILLENAVGTASGLVLENQTLFPGALLIAMPGVPTEMKEMFVHQALPLLEARFTQRQGLIVKTLHFVGLIENQLDPILRIIKQRYPHIACGIYPSFSTVSVQLRGTNARELEEATLPFVEAFNKHIFAAPSGTLVEAVHLELLRQNLTLATAESCTGGALSAAFVANPDASRYLLGGIVAYSNAVKESLLSVDRLLLETHGAVSEEVTCQMALSICQKLGSNLGIAVSGILGPSGGTPEKPVGTVAASIVHDNRVVLSWTMHLKGTRQHLIKKVVEQILARLYFYLKN